MTILTMIRHWMVRRLVRLQRPRQDSNLGTRFRKPMLYPLSYEGGDGPERGTKRSCDGPGPPREGSSAVLGRSIVGSTDQRLCALRERGEPIDLERARVHPVNAGTSGDGELVEVVDDVVGDGGVGPGPHDGVMF